MAWKNVEKLRCPRCRSVRLRLAGFWHKKQRYECKRCGAFTIAPKGGKK